MDHDLSSPRRRPGQLRRLEEVPGPRTTAMQRATWAPQGGRLTTMRTSELVAWLDEYLDIAAFDDSSMNGLQVEGADEVNKVVVAVDASYNTFESAVTRGADMIIV